MVLLPQAELWNSCFKFWGALQQLNVVSNTRNHTFDFIIKIHILIIFMEYFKFYICMILLGLHPL